MNVRRRAGSLTIERRVAVGDHAEMPDDGLAAVGLDEPAEPHGQHRARCEL